jgi:hypothetical protein
MLYPIAGFLIVVWLLIMIISHTISGLFHLILAAALVLIVLAIFRRHPPP